MSDGGNVVPRITKAEHIGPNDTGDNIEAKRVAGYGFNGTDWQRNAPAASGLITAPHDNVVATRDGNSDTFAYKRGGTVVQTLVITYTDASKENIDTMVVT